MSKPISDRLKHIRATLGLSQSEAAKEWDIPLRTLQGWESTDPKRQPRGFYKKQLESILAAYEHKPKPSSDSDSSRPG